MLVSLSALCQKGSEWIVAGQQYYKIKTYQNGIYAVPFNQLQTAGINTSDLTNLQMWFRGQEQAVYLNNDTLFFYGKRNDGTLDSLLYGTGLQAHKYYNILSDTCAYFLTIGAAPGKRMQNSSIPAGTTASTWYYEQYLAVYTDRYYRGTYYTQETVKSEYDQGEGWFGTPIQTNGSPATSNFSIPLSNVNPDPAAVVKIEVQVVGGYPATGRNVKLLIGNASSPDFTFSFPPFNNYDYAKLSIQIPASYLQNNSSLNCNIQIFNSTYDYIGATYIKVLYPRNYTLTNAINQTLFLDNAEAGDKKIQISNVTAPVFIINNTDLLNQQVVPYSTSSAKAVLNVSSTVKQLFIQNAAFNKVVSITPVDLSIPVFTNAFNIIYPEVFASSAQQYVAYRSSANGGNYSAGKCSFEKLCNVFSYGEWTPLAIKRYCDEIILANPDEKYLLLLGKGTVPSLNAFIPNQGSFYYRKNPAAFWNSTDYKTKLVSFVPTFGEPGSDLMFSIDANHAAQIHTGRVPARTAHEIDEYLEKVRMHESLDSNLIWRKRAVHLSGGETTEQITLFKKFVDTYKAYFQGPYFGGRVIKTYVKNLQNGAIDDQLISGISTDINNGISLLTLFGHSSAEISDIDIGFVSNPVYGYKNTGKYPMLLMNGCTSADIFSTYSFAEDWINTPKLGAITVLGHTDIGYTNYLNQFSTYYYNFQFNDERYRNKSIGFIQRKVIDSMNSINNVLDITAQGQITQMNLSGDPALKIYSPSKPDYAIYGDNQTAERVCSLVPDNGTKITSQDPFTISIPIDNYGSTTNKTVEVIVKRYVNNVLVKSYQATVIPVSYKDSITISVSNNESDFSGNNRFEIQVDPSDSLKEIRKDNNIAYLNYFIPTSAVKCLFPLDYSIASNQPVTLLAQPTNLLIPETDYYFEIDTTKKFNSLFKQTKVITSGSLPSWTPQLLSNILPSDSIVYFWRVRFNTIASGEDTLWDNSSFIYIKNSNSGWSQTTIDQFQENVLNGLKYNKNTLRWEFPATSVALKARAIGGRTTGEPDETLLSLNNLPILQSSTYYNCVGNGGFFLFILDRSSLEPKTYQPNTEGWFYCGQNFDTRYVQEISYPANTNTPPSVTWLYGRDADGLIKAIQNTNKNDYIIIMNDGNSLKEQWASVLTNYLRDSLHATAITNLTSGQQPFILVTKRNEAIPISEKVNLSTATDSYVAIDTTLTGFYDKGSIQTDLIGPSSKWGKMYLGIDSAASDITSIQLIRYAVSGNILDTVFVPKTDSLNLNGTYLTDGVHAYCKLLLNIKDDVNLTPAELTKWQIIYSGVPEGTLNPYAVGLDKYAVQTRSEGDTISMTYRFDNISNLDFTKPIKVIYSIRNESGTLKVDTVTYTALPANQNLFFTYKIPTKGWVGKNYLQAYVNPQIQPEQYYSNNVLETTFFIEADKTQPTLEVAFDGVRIFDGDLVSASPLINISLRDNNKYLLMTDPSSVKLFLQYPGQTVPVQITSTNPIVQSWSLQQSKTNTFVAEIKPVGLPDGTYILSVQGQDATGNKAGNNTYKITFKVENKPTISYFYPYPNPFSTSTRFVFTLSGTTVPSDLKIQIMTISGIVVKEIFKEELGPIHIGNNISEYAWNGTDQYGDRLANGVYLYRVIIKDDTQTFEHRENAGDKAFKHDWGKLYILR